MGDSLSYFDNLLISVVVVQPMYQIKVVHDVRHLWSGNLIRKQLTATILLLLRSDIRPVPRFFRICLPRVKKVSVRSSLNYAI